MSEMIEHLVTDRESFLIQADEWIGTAIYDYQAGDLDESAVAAATIAYALIARAEAEK